MMKMKTNKKIAGAAAMLLLSTTMLGTSTFAWFTMNREVTITGMEVKTHVGSNLLIQKGALTDTSTLSESSFVTDETQTIKAILEPVSTTTAQPTDFWYTLDATAAGSKLHTPIGSDTNETIEYKDYDAYGLTATGTGFDSTNYTNWFSQDYGVTKSNNIYATESPAQAVGYVDYVFQLKATNSEASPADINLTKLQLKYGSATDGDRAFRAAIFVSDAQEVGGTFKDWTSAIQDSSSANIAAAIYTPANAANFESGKAVKTASTRDTVTYVNAATPIASVPANSVKYYKVCVRLWIEGEDDTCNTSTFKALTDSWKLDLQMELGQGTGVANIDMQTTTPEP
jgi:hypothetical protein